MNNEYINDNKILIEDKIKNNSLEIIKYRKLINELEQTNLKLENELNKNHQKTYNFDLNEQQALAVKEITCNNIIIACPGSGKTHTLIAKVNHLINYEQIDPQKIIMITFTKKTAQEMNERLLNKVGCNNLLHVGTLHGLAYRTLQRYDKINYTILDENDCHKSIRNIYEELLKRPKYHNKYNDEIQSYLYKKIVTLYDVLMTRYPIKLKELLQDKKLSEYFNIIRDTYINYQKFKKDNKYLDFNDLMVKFIEFLNDGRSDSFKSSYDYILFDEYQDINCIQDLILRQLNSKCYNLTVVGDDAQAIYSFRGSEVKYIINFKDTYDNVKIHKLESNYRSVPEIVDFCNHIIKCNNNQLEKNMVAVKESINIKPKITGFTSVNDEVRYIIDKIKDNVKCGVSLKEHVIITRKNRQLDNFEMELVKNKINYVKSKGIGIMDRIHIKDFLAFLIVLANKDSVIHWKRILSLLPGIGGVTVMKIVSLMSTDSNLNIPQIILKPHTYLSPIISNKMKDLSHLYTKMIKLYEKTKYDKLCTKIISFLKPIIKSRMTIKEKTPYEDKIDDLQTLKNYIITSESLVNFLADIHLNVEIEKKNNFINNDDLEKSNDYLYLSTIHGAKGLEWDYVYLAGCSSDMIPSLRSNIYTIEIDDFEEERRLFYVGCSRARKSLELTLSYDYHFVSNHIYASPFIKDLDPNLYNGLNLNFPKRLDKGDVTHIINNYMLLHGSSKVYPYLKSLKYTYKSYYRPHYEPLIYKNKCELIYGTFIDNLIAKMIHQEYLEVDTDNYIPLHVPIYERSNINYDVHYYNYVDPSNDWQDIINSILRISIIKTNLPMKFVDLYKLLTSIEQIKLYQNINNMIRHIMIDCIKSAKEKGQKMPKDIINLHHNISYGSIMGEADVVIGRTLIEIKTSRECIATTKYVLQTLMYRYMLRKKDIRIDNIIMMNPLLGEIYTLRVTPDWKHNFRVFATIMT